jgi:ankyrin repeat protein
MMVEAGADLLAADSANWTPLDAAAFHCHLDIVNYLLSKGD